MEHVKKILLTQAPAIFKSSPVLFAYIYGSVAEGMAHQCSDLDIGVYASGELHPRESLDLELSLSLDIDEAIDHSVESEVRVINPLPLVIKGKIITDGILIYCVDDDLRVNFETRVRSEYFDFLPVLHHYQHMYRESIIHS